MEGKQVVTSRKRKRFGWWKKHAPKAEKVVKKSEKPLKEAPEKKISVKQESTDKLENDEKKNRYILFVGNLPFSVNEEQVKDHFRCTENIKEFRLMTKKTGESKGCGFLEFDNKASYWKALNLHHSVMAGRKINVEITCGGGGKGEKREKKLRERKSKFRQGRKRKSKPTKVKANQKDNSLANTNSDT
ncbi:uncharacterized RNA-binding protein C365.04c-like isoform X1 [Orbicella faveolata]|uniref:uncharacterized RNA-binding protein C365.04c-like isoform X1 n=1 Tax=Orbicella faveolata TaxID=48498 RepID=UPI0009E1CF77|nr:uncharacterized RNA-binding protein C365.04c-like isoform X1 [Orbicella faveolata]